ncbi:p-hydroxybenzoic acid efflux pump subunit AaeB [Paraburkholderia domus]|uniref:p-hydroxybenzoic acid efflux pump subunit AaeB n=1 Tax=Paraburkholderia domus TaxID=2793075 RepID=A0A9N8MTI7_9BURK|nr:FUSC family protein [Paraburkholderia domus]MBK5051263.1 FUSC family protein [Burkholderia sp. R-70006]MBK5061235.1 FUSC family protein [Burkholderia sp. R-70199]MBK5090679.1 FUSC family protein [Burkholderia sp. R-69927]MBK5121036.1 FUSC family protein [Burkholderia sp. R-69980]MBK5166430.1 FUSC family protein [Burkholderia sp. R-70211]MBK5185025.1 FUSC family protein [Burkholderia sp. R-69749]MCI0146584.1 FUSC family protein [Paraburkholderia sediminicola]
MVYPSIRDWLFSVKTFAAAMIALYIGLALELPRPYWAMATVYIVSNPFVGATRSKALYRALGTALGASAAVLLVPPFVESPYLFSVIVALWTGTLLYLAVADRTARSYVFMLAAYTMPIIALPSVTNPGGVFDLAISRTEEITLGIVCASIVGSSLFPSRLAPTIIERTDAWFRDAAFYATETLSGRIAGSAISGARQRIAATINGLELLLSQLAYDHTRPDILARAHELRGRMQFLLPMMSALADPLIALYNSGRQTWPEGLEALLNDVIKWFNAPLPAASGGYHPDPTANALRDRIAAMQPPPAALATWNGALLSNALWRLKQVIDVWQDCRSLRIIITREEGSWRPRFRHWRMGGTERFFDRGIMLFSTVSAGAAVIIACSLWISSGWADGASAVTLAAVACCFFAALDEPAPMVFKFFVATAVSVVAAGIYLFAVLPHVHDFPMLVILFAAPFILVGTLIPRPQFNMVTVLVAVNTATFISIQDAYSADFLIFLNSNLAGLAGLLYAYLWTRVTRPFGAELAASRLLRSSWADVALTASTRTIEDPRNLASRMLDRLMQLIPRLAATDDHRHPSIESFRDLRIAFNALDLRRLTHKLGGEAPAAIAHVLEDVCQYFETCIDQRARQPVPESLMSSIDAAVARVTAQGLANAEAPSATSQTSARRLRDALHALVGLRLSLFPATLITPTPPEPETAA